MLFRSITKSARDTQKELMKTRKFSKITVVKIEKRIDVEGKRLEKIETRLEEARRFCEEIDDDGINRTKEFIDLCDDDEITFYSVDGNGKMKETVQFWVDKTDDDDLDDLEEDDDLEKDDDVFGTTLPVNF